MSEQKQTSSVFGLNILALFILSALIPAIADRLPAGAEGILNAAGSLGWVLFVFGMLYGLSRLTGAKSAPLEEFYQHFPLFWWNRGASVFGSLEMERQRNEGPAVPAGRAGESHDEPLSFRWESLFSFKYLRYLGILLIISSLFSIIFKIEWQLIHKIIAAAVAGACAMAAAEWLHRRGKGEIAVTSSLVGFALLQFALSLLSAYMREFHWATVWADPNVWLVLKTVLTLGYLFPLQRYPSPYHSFPFLGIAYLTPLSLQMASTPVDARGAGLFLLIMTGIALVHGLRERRDGVFLLNAVLSFGFAFGFFFANDGFFSIPTPSPWWGLILVFILFLAHLTATVGALFPEPRRPAQALMLHAIAIHVLMALTVLQSGTSLPLIDEYLGFAFLAVACCPFIAFLFIESRRIRTDLSETFLNLAIILSTVGIFLQVHNRWSAVLFLACSCGV
ncbi:MAG: hypothetical protein PHW10_04680, partial [Candidatus Peribacteraceae bacterium]|nr:hypothetical protein [Candidatus Peribacteraceae bacterium]